jgi:hypothetical protein
MEIYVAHIDGVAEIGVALFVSNSKDKVIEDITKCLSYNPENKTYDKIAKVVLVETNNTTESYDLYFEGDEENEPSWDFHITKTILLMA